MALCNIERCSTADASSLARNNITAFWNDPTWKLQWPEEVTLDFLIEQSTKRQPRNLLRNRHNTRHQKVVNHVTGGLLGYARWILPSGHFDSNNGDTEWSEAQIPDVSDEEKKQFMDLAESAWWDARDDMNALEDRILVVMDRLLAENIYIRLDYLAVHPENQRKGVGTALVESGIRYAKSVGIPIFTMAFNASRGFYERLGFREVERIVQDDSRYGGAGKYGAYFMVYDV